MTVRIDIAGNRADRKWSRGELAGRALWMLAQPLFRWSPRPLWGWRRTLLRLFGAQVGQDAHIFPSVRIAIPWNLSIGRRASMGDDVRCYNLGPIRIGEAATISQGVHLCGGTHDHRSVRFELVKAPIAIGDGAWICADAFVGPGITVGEYAILGARAVAMKSLPPGTVWAGNPARLIGHRNTASRPPYNEDAPLG